jgi:hypothetical protein
MKRFCLTSAMIAAAALLAPPAAAADYYAPRHAGPRHHAKPHHAYHHHGKIRRGWTCNRHGNCQPMWGWGKDVATGPVAMVIVARGDIPLYERPDRYTSCKMPRLEWTGWRWVKAWDVNCVR